VELKAAEFTFGMQKLYIELPTLVSDENCKSAEDKDLYLAFYFRINK